MLAFVKYLGEMTGKALTDNVELLGFVLLSNPIRSTAKETFQYFAEQGVDVKVISGDNPVTVSRVAEEAGIKEADKYVECDYVLQLTRTYMTPVLNITYLDVCVPEQKRQFVKALKAQGKTVGMTGDGVNDVLALKEANCSMARGGFRK